MDIMSYSIIVALVVVGQKWMQHLSIWPPRPHLTGEHEDGDGGAGSLEATDLCLALLGTQHGPVDAAEGHSLGPDAGLREGRAYVYVSRANSNGRGLHRVMGATQIRLFISPPKTDGIQHTQHLLPHCPAHSCHHPYLQDIEHDPGLAEDERSMALSHQPVEEGKDE